MCLLAEPRHDVRGRERHLIDSWVPGHICRWASPRPAVISVRTSSEQRRIVADLAALQAPVNEVRRLQAETWAELDAPQCFMFIRAFKDAS